MIAKDALEALDNQAASIAAGTTRIALALAEALEEVDRTRVWREMGFSSMTGYTIERTNRSARWGIDSRALARRLARLPLLRDALVTRRVTWSMAELTSRHATVENETALVEEAKRSTIRRMRKRFGLEQPEESPKRSVRTTVPLEDRGSFEAARMRIEAIEGRRLTTDEVMTALLAEGWITLVALDIVPDTMLEAEEERRALVRAWRRQVEAWQLEAEERCEARLERRPVIDNAPDDVAPEGESLDARVVRLAKRLAGLDLELGVVLEELFAQDGWRRLGYASARQYAQERIGLSHASIKNRIRLARDCGRFPRLGEALRRGRIGLEAAKWIARIADNFTVDEWIAHAERRTAKHLREEVEAAELYCSLTGDRYDTSPPDPATLAEAQEIERKARSGELVGISSEMSATGPTVEVRLTMSDDNAAMWHALERLYTRTGLRGSLLRFLCAALYEACPADPAMNRMAYAALYRRERWRCASPICDKSNLTPHHIRYRTEENLEDMCGQCLECHLYGVHEGRLSVSGLAPNLTWRLGRRGEIIVMGREKIRG